MLESGFHLSHCAVKPARAEKIAETKTDQQDVSRILLGKERGFTGLTGRAS